MWGFVAFLHLHDCQMHILVFWTVNRTSSLKMLPTFLQICFILLTKCIEVDMLNSKQSNRKLQVARHVSSVWVSVCVFVFLHVRWNVLCCTGYTHVWNQGGRAWSPNSTWPVLPHQNSNRGVCVHVSTAEKGSCSGGILICQVGLIKSSTGREGDGGDLPWPVSDMKETKKSLMTFQ